MTFTRERKLLIAGGGYADIPLITAAKKMGYYVITTGNRPTELGHLYSDEYQCGDFSDREEMLNLSKRLKIDAICACCNDFSALSCAYVAEQLGLPGHDPYEIAKLIHHKDLYRHFAASHGISTPKAIGFTSLYDAECGIQSLTFPLLIKPVDLTGGKGISKVFEPRQVRTALENAFRISREKRIVVEEFVTGSHHGFSIFLLDGKVVFFFSDDEYYYLNPFLVSAASSPSRSPASAEKKLCHAAEKIASLLSLKTGIFHIQYILHQDEPIIIEICRRAPGDLYVKFVEYATGVPYSSWIVKASCGLDCNDIYHADTKGFFTRHCVMSAATGVVKKVNFNDTITKNVIDKFMWLKKGDQITDVMTSKAGIVFLQFDSLSEMIDKTTQMQHLIHIEVEE